MSLVPSANFKRPGLIFVPLAKIALAQEVFVVQLRALKTAQLAKAAMRRHQTAITHNAIP